MFEEGSWHPDVHINSSDNHTGSRVAPRRAHGYRSYSTIGSFIARSSSIVEHRWIYVHVQCRGFRSRLPGRSHFSLLPKMAAADTSFPCNSSHSSSNQIGKDRETICDPDRNEIISTALLLKANHYWTLFVRILSRDCKVRGSSDPLGEMVREKKFVVVGILK